MTNRYRSIYRIHLIPETFGLELQVLFCNGDSEFLEIPEGKTEKRLAKFFNRLESTNVFIINGTIDVAATFGRYKDDPNINWLKDWVKF